jgi:hypothetical protein
MKNTYWIDCLVICVKNKLFKKPHELTHQPNIYAHVYTRNYTGVKNRVTGFKGV